MDLKYSPIIPTQGFITTTHFIAYNRPEKISQVVSPFMKLGNIAPREITHFIVVVKLTVEHLGNKECLCTLALNKLSYVLYVQPMKSIQSINIIFSTT